MNLFPNLLIIPVGAIIGILVAAPVGPVNVLCIQRALERGALAGIVAGLGAVLGDGLIAAMAALGVGAILSVVETHKVTIQLVGGAALLLFGWMLLRSPLETNATLEPDPDNGERARAHPHFDLWDIPKTFFLTVTNPGAVLGLLAIIGGISSYVEISGTADALLLVASIMGGSIIWWAGLSTFIARVRHSLSAAALHKINLLAGLALVAFGAVLIGELIWTSWVA